MAPDGFLWYLILGTFAKICLEIPNLVKMGQKHWALYMETWLVYSVDSSMHIVYPDCCDMDAFAAHTDPKIQAF